MNIRPPPPNYRSGGATAVRWFEKISSSSLVLRSTGDSVLITALGIYFMARHVDICSFLIRFKHCENVSVDCIYPGRLYVSYHAILYNCNSRVSTIELKTSMCESKIFYIFYKHFPESMFLSSCIGHKIFPYLPNCIS